MPALTHLPRRIGLVVGAAMLTAFAFVLLVTPSAWAHDALVETSPAAESTIETLPAELTLTFSAALIEGEGATAVQVTDPAGESAADGAPVLDGAIVTQPLVDHAVAGEYHVVWRVVSSDGHPVSGEFTFEVTTGTATTPAPDQTASASPEATPGASTPVTTANAGEGTPADGDSFLAALPWIILGIVVAAGGGAAVAVLIARARRAGSASDSDTSAEL